MIYLSYSFQFLSFAAGMVSLYIALQLYNQYKFQYLKSNVYLTCGYIFIILMNSVGSILEIQKNGAVEFRSIGFYEILTFVVIPIVLLFVLHHFQAVFFGLINKKSDRKAGIVRLVILILFVILQGLILVINTIPFVALVLPLFVVQILFYVQIFWVLSFFGKTIKQGLSESHRRWLKYIYFSEMIYFVLLIILTIVQIAGLIHIHLYMVISSFAAMIINPLVMFLFVKHHNSAYSSSEMIFNQLILQYQITDREKEIIQLACKGKTNKEIGEVLFISPLTVRDHLSSIFNKVGVNNRTKLSGIFK